MKVQAFEFGHFNRQVGLSRDSGAATELLNRLQALADIQFDRHFTGHWSNLEFDIYYWVKKGQFPELLQLSESCHGWWTYDVAEEDGYTKIFFIPINEWIDLYRQWYDGNVPRAIGKP